MLLLNIDHVPGKYLCHNSSVRQKQRTDAAAQKSIKGNGQGIIALLQCISSENTVECIAKSGSESIKDSFCGKSSRAAHDSRHESTAKKGDHQCCYLL